MDDVRELVSYLSKAERGYTKTLNREFLKAGFDLSREQYELLQVLWAEDHVNQQTISKRLQNETIEYPDETWVCAAENVSGR